MEQNNTNILYVEDDENLGMLVSDFLEMEGFNIHLCSNGEEALKVYKKQDFDLCLLDIMLPKMDGYTLAEKIRKNNSQLPIIFLSAKSQEEDRIKGFLTGADDYITKPFSTEELKLRIISILRRSKPQLSKAKKVKLPKKITLGTLVYNTVTMRIIDGENEQRLTKKENELLKLLLANKNRVVTREEALLSIWGSDDHLTSRSMDVYITKLRKILKADPNIFITNYHGTGFQIEIKQN